MLKARRLIRFGWVWILPSLMLQIPHRKEILDTIHGTLSRLMFSQEKKPDTEITQCQEKSVVPIVCGNSGRNLYAIYQYMLDPDPE